MSAFASCGRAVAHVRGGSGPGSDVSKCSATANVRAQVYRKRIKWRLGPGADHGRMACIAEAWDRSTPGATSRSTISSASVRLQRLRLACQSGAQLIPILATRFGWPVLAMHVYGQIYSIHFERGPPCQKSEVEGEIERQIEIARSPRRAGEQRRPSGGRLLSAFRRWRLRDGSSRLLVARSRRSGV